MKITLHCLHLLPIIINSNDFTFRCSRWWLEWFVASIWPYRFWVFINIQCWWIKIAVKLECMVWLKLATIESKDQLPQTRVEVFRPLLINYRSQWIVLVKLINGNLMFLGLQSKENCVNPWIQYISVYCCWQLLSTPILLLNLNYMGHFHWLGAGSLTSGSQGFHAAIFFDKISSFSAWMINSSTCPLLILSSSFFTSVSCSYIIGVSYCQNNSRHTINTSATAAALSVMICSVYFLYAASCGSFCNERRVFAYRTLKVCSGFWATANPVSPVVTCRKSKYICYQIYKFQHNFISLIFNVILK